MYNLVFDNPQPYLWKLLPTLLRPALSAVVVKESKTYSKRIICFVNYLWWYDLKNKVEHKRGKLTVLNSPLAVSILVWGAKP